MAQGVWTVDDYLRTAPEAYRGVLNQLRTFCRVLLLGYEEKLRFGAPTYFRYGQAEVAFSVADGRLSFCVFNDRIAQRFADVFEPGTVSCLRYASPQQIDFELVEKILRASADSHNLLLG